MAIALNCFAYYGDYSSSYETPGWLVFTGIIMIIGGILEIILFFKIWNMTNNVKALKKDYFNENEFETNEAFLRYLRRNLVIGNINNVKRILLQNFISNINVAYNELPLNGYKTDENGKNKWVNLKEDNMKKSIRPYVDNLQKQFDKIGEELPIYIQRMECFADYYRVFTTKDLEIKFENTSEDKKD
jgi:hypothetical protein